MRGMKLDDFQHRVIASGLVDEDDVAALRLQLPVQTIQAFGELLVAKQLVTPWQCAMLVEGRYKGFFVDHYKILDFIGSDGHTLRYLVENTRTSKHAILSTKPKPPMAGEPFAYEIEKLVPPATA
jgi:hypothetical protein